MTPAKLNEICCNFAEIEPTNSTVGKSGYRHTNYPLVSSDWGQAGRLMEALPAKYHVKTIRAFRNRRLYFCTIQVLAIGHLVDPDLGSWRGLAESFPRALCLAVAELAKEVGGAI